ncbi:hypothetical protein ABE073_04095 [Lederbergia citrisecunda]|uniref:hypothetical protein n=1 Tax=Lederbergia citrisecunda TaxID=2833583 RepID=UPI003D29D05B
MASASHRYWMNEQDEKIEEVKTGLLAIVQRQREIKNALIDLTINHTEDGSYFDSNVYKGKQYMVAQGIMIQSVNNEYHIVEVPEWFGGVAVAYDAIRDELTYEYYNYIGKMENNSIRGLCSSNGIHIA